MVIDICNELGQNFIDFSYEANSARAFADARDGLKPGQRACLWEMYNSGYSSKKPPVKSAKIAGAVSGNWWPHGNTAIYETFARMSQPWINNIPEVGWHGNNGSQYTGPDCASDRYTEARLAPIVEDGMFEGIKKNNVPMIQNYSEDAEWPEVLPAIFPRLMVNGCQGIGSTIANVWLPHSLNEVAEILIEYINTGVLNYSNLYPSFPTGGTIINKNDISSIYATGKGKAILRGKAEIKDNKILITELPYQVYVQPYVEKIKEMAIKDELTGIEAVYNKSGKDILLIEIECGESPSHVLKQLYTKTDLQKNYNANQWALVGKTPRLLTLKDYCDIYLSHNISCIVREKTYDLEKAKSRLHIVDGLLIALEDIDNVIKLIKNSESSAAARDNLMRKYSLSEIQAKAILAMRLSSLAHMEKIELENEKKDLINSINEIEEILASSVKQKAIVCDRLNSLCKKYKDTRKTNLTQIETPKNEDKEIINVEPEKCVVVMTKSGMIKRIPTASFKVQRRNGRGIKSEDDIANCIIRTNTIDNLMIFTNKGKMYRILVDNIPEGTNASKGQYIKSIIDMEPDEEPTVMYSIYRDTDAKYVLFVTNSGLVKKTALEGLVKTRKKTGLPVIGLAEGDAIASVSLINEESLILLTKNGMGIHFESKSISTTGRTARGIKGINLKSGDSVVVALPVRHKTDMLAVFTKDGMGKKLPLKDLTIQNRAGKGLICSKEEIAAAALIDDNDKILVKGNSNSICIEASDIPIGTRIALGVQIIKGNNIKGVTKV